MRSDYSEQQSALQFKGGNLTITTLELLTPDCAQIEQELSRQTQKAPAFFCQTPVLLSFEQLEEVSVALEMVVDVCKRNGLIPIAVRCSQDMIKKSAWALGLGWFPPLTEHRLKEVKKKPSCPQRLPTRFVKGAVRSGQQVYASCADLVVIGSVNEGAEVIADGNVQVWGALRGRAIAGAQGDVEARVLCQQFSAELVSVAGVFQVFDTCEFPATRDLPVEVRLENDSLVLI
ncbi:septum site-determining protein MinC [Oceanospirillum linum]|uniref:septum site-determining protein MinC n=1 Tax=Oceanospirillum linum TaxID=966 RepID=UPI00089E45FA|nr:septum site-determining protein MinC [Oceanospirillum linum]SEG52162.1 septum site-determining protein MinC [Oleiphilus messinensis]SMP35913.1 septum site-determining protein MinC [Oceanospirillum linum]